MYRKDSTGWIKHVDFIILDLICLQVAFVLAYVLSGYGANPYQLILYRNMAVFMEVADLVVLFAMGTLKNVLKRGYYKDFVVTAQHGVILGACLLLYLFMLQEGQQYSRLALILNIVIYILLTYLVRELWKHLLRKKMEDGENRSLLLVVSADVVSAVVESMKEHKTIRELFQKADITYDVNFTHLIHAFEQSGARVEMYATQMKALVEFGLIELLEILQKNVSEKAYSSEMNKVKILIDPSFMGERFKMVCFRA